MSSISHESIRPDRQDMIGECVFSEHWRQLMAGAMEFVEDDDDAPQLSHIIDCRADQRDATVAATIVQWLGTNVGGSLVHEGKRIRKALTSGFAYYDCFLMVWSSENRRRRHVNHGTRILELLLLQPDAKRDFMGRPYDLPKITMRDTEVADQLMGWLGSDKGWAWLGEVEAEIALRQDAARHYRGALV